MEAATAVRLAARYANDDRAARQLRRAERLLRREIGPSVPKRRAAALLGISVTALERWIAAGSLPVVRRPGGREEVDAEALLDLVEEVRRLRDDEGVSRGVVARAFRRLAERGLPRPKLRPNTLPSDLRRSYLSSTPVERLAEAAELSLAATTLAAAAHPSRLRPLRFFDLVRTLCAHGVEFVLVGGFAVGFHGAERATRRVDVVLAPGEENETRLRHAVEILDASPETLDGRGGNWILQTRFGRLDVMQWVAPFDSYDELRRNAVGEYVEELGSTLLVAGLDDLIAMKEAAGRDQDRIDVAALRMAHGLEE